MDYEVIIIDDYSPDDTWEVLLKLKKIYERLIIVRLLRNSGQHNAILCGFSIAKGDIIITMDDDLQNPPEEITKLIAAINQADLLQLESIFAQKSSVTYCISLIDGLKTSKRWCHRISYILLY